MKKKKMIIFGLILFVAFVLCVVILKSCRRNESASEQSQQLDVSIDDFGVSAQGE